MAVGGLCGLLTLFHLALALPPAFNPGRTLIGRDLDAYYTAARAAAHRESPYTDVGEWTMARTPRVYLYPPPFAVATAPLGLLSPLAFYRVWFTLLEVALWGFCLSLVWLATRRWEGSAALLVGPLAFSPLLIGSFMLGNADVIVLATCALALVAALYDRPYLAAALVAAAACMKIYPAVLLIPLARRSGYRSLGAAGAILLAANAAAWLWLGGRSYRDFMTRAVPVASQGTLHAANLSPAALLARSAAALGWFDPTHPAPGWLRAGMAIAGGLFLVAACVVAARLPFELAFSGAASLSVLAGAISWASYWPVVLILVAVLWHARRAPAGRGFAWVVGGALAASVALDPLPGSGPLAVAGLLLLTWAISRLPRATCPA
jgi:hypothetical protein